MLIAIFSIDGAKTKKGKQMNPFTLFCIWLMTLFTCQASSAAVVENAMNLSGAFHAVSEKEVLALLVEYKIPSISIARIENGKMVFAHAFGMQSPDHAASSSTLYNIASMTKPISAEIVLRLITQEGRDDANFGKLSAAVGIDEPMYTYWLDPDVVQDARVKLLTPRLALSHQTGFPNWRYQTKNVLQFLFEPGARFSYSGEGFEYVAHFAEKKWKKPFEELAQERLFQPLGMMDTAYTKQAWFEGRVALPSDSEGRALDAVFSKSFLASDLLYSTPGDYAKFMISVMENQALSPALANERNRIQVRNRTDICPEKAEKFCPLDVGFALGWERYDYPHDQYMMHTGSDEGVFTFGYFNATKRSGIVIFTNGANGGKIIVPLLEKLGIDSQFVAYLKATVN
jgi:CubicO group peptidase (beta-lactamase class C family)